ncbi:glycosyltransferase family 4 protein [Microvirga aerilata]|uniref:Glycosyltransferase family 4 protein n=1 Tax=Microvirga aerilata TaxID=670292 RepID=A0A936ZAA8_9HYPH|nr:glycosyltransferase family 4 protein [Microvirga aerilata]MBL0405967.1 glycosyltransferase family 4 protein [Microvirga aerilata]
MSSPSLNETGQVPASVSLDGAGLHVLMTADAVGGVWQYALDLAESLRRHGVETTLAVLGPAPSVDQQATAEAAGAQLILTGLPLDWTAEAREEVEEAGRAIARIAAQVKPNIVHLNSPALAASARFDAPVVAVCHSCVATWWQAVKGGALPEAFVWRMDMVGQGYAAADRLLAPTQAFARTTAQVYDLADAPLVVRNGRRSPNLETRASTEPFVFTAGRLWDEGKNFAVIDRAAARLSVPVLAAGPLQGPNGARIEAHAVKALGRVSDTEIARHLSANPIFVSAARYEPFGLAVLEAAQAGCPLILSDIETFRELWEGAAVFVPTDDEEAIVAAVERLVQDAQARADLGRAARRRADAYTVDVMSAGVLAAYRSVLARSSHESSLEGAAA